MNDRELFQETFSRLHASADTMTEVKKRMNHKEKRNRARLTKRAVTLALAAALLLALGVTAYATDLFGMNVRPATEEALHLLAPTLENVAAERIREELFRLLCGPGAGRIQLRFCL